MNSFAQQTPANPLDDQGRWYLFQCATGQEKIVRKTLIRRGNEENMEAKLLQVVVAERGHIYAGYILIKMVWDDSLFNLIRHTPAITGFIGSGHKPIPMRDDEAIQMLRDMKQKLSRFSESQSFQEGQTVRIMQGSFKDFQGVVDVVDNEAVKLRVTVSVFGRETTIEVGFEDVEAVKD